MPAPPQEDEAHQLTQFVREHGQSLMRLGYLLTRGDEARAEDLYQAVLATLAARGLDGLDAPLAYARRAMTNHLRDTARRDATVRRHLPRLVETAPTGDHAPGLTDRLALFGALDQLTERERTVVVLRYYEDLPDPEIAATLDCAVPTVRSIAHRAMPKLRALLTDDGPPPPAGTPRPVPASEDRA